MTDQLKDQLDGALSKMVSCTFNGNKAYDILLNAINVYADEKAKRERQNSDDDVAMDDELFAYQEEMGKLSDELKEKDDEIDSMQETIYKLQDDLLWCQTNLARVEEANR